MCVLCSLFICGHLTFNLLLFLPSFLNLFSFFFRKTKQYTSVYLHFCANSVWNLNFEHQIKDFCSNVFHYFDNKQCFSNSSVQVQSIFSVTTTAQGLSNSSYLTSSMATSSTLNTSVFLWSYISGIYWTGYIPSTLAASSILH